jgi:general secretion pathway protein A
MYEKFYNVRTNPFALTPDPEYLFLSEEQREAMASLMYGVLARRGFSVLIGDAGTGKTTLLRALMRSIPESRAVFSVIVNPTLTASEFLRTCITGFGIAVGESPKDVVLSHLRRFLVRLHEEKTVAVLVIDEAQRLSTELLEEVRLLTNFETDKDKLIQIILAGQDELAVMLDRYDLRQLKQRVSTRVHINPLTPQSVAAYIRYRWNRCSSEPLPFDPAALVSIAEMSGGTPRLINSICENALLLGFAQGQRTIDAAVVTSVASDLRLAQSQQRRPMPAVAAAPQPVVERESDSAVVMTKSQENARPSLEKYAVRRGWRVLFGLD